MCVGGGGGGGSARGCEGMYIFIYLILVAFFKRGEGAYMFIYMIFVAFILTYFIVNGCVYCQIALILARFQFLLKKKKYY